MLRQVDHIIDRKNFILIVVVATCMALIGVVAPYFLYKHRQAALLRGQKTEQSSTNLNSEKIAVSYTNKGFKPATITIKAGISVVWTNESDKQMWVASDPHPVHNGLPGFDQGGTDSKTSLLQKIGLVGRAEAHAGLDATYTHAFTEKGKWPYHNHLSPGDKGKVIVE